MPLHAIVRPDGLSAAERSDWAADQLDLFNPSATKRIVTTWIATPTVAGVIAFVTFEAAERFHRLT
uniref:hypothetical protein n=1 Tax=Halobacterium sp. (strain GN101) TaxID=88773 RepID=UPI00159EBF69|nr:hypothetical protein [Halobacterium sp. GN101]